jgi:hypothetical protein
LCYLEYMENYMMRVLSKTLLERLVIHYLPRMSVVNLEMIDMMSKDINIYDCLLFFALALLLILVLSMLGCFESNTYGTVPGLHY